MSDFELFITDGILDIDIAGGEVRLIDDTEAQRACVGAYMQKGSIPGFEELGVNWANLFTGGSSIVELDNEVQPNMKTFAPSKSYLPVYDVKSGSIGIQLIGG